MTSVPNSNLISHKSLGDGNSPNALNKVDICRHSTASIAEATDLLLECAKNCRLLIEDMITAVKCSQDAQTAAVALSLHAEGMGSNLRATEDLLTIINSKTHQNRTSLKKATNHAVVAMKIMSNMSVCLANSAKVLSQLSEACDNEYERSRSIQAAVSDLQSVIERLHRRDGLQIV